MPRLDSPVRFEHGSLVEIDQELQEEVYNQLLEQANVRSARINGVEFSREEVEMPETRARTRTRTTPAIQRTATGTTEPVVANTEIRYNVRAVSHYGLEGINYMRPVLEEYAQLLRRDIVITNNHASSKVPHIGPDLHIYFYSRPSEVCDYVAHYDNAFGIELSQAQGDFAMPTPEDVSLGSLVEDDEGQPVMLIVEDTLYVLFDLPHGYESAGYLMRAVMEAYVANLNPEEANVRKERALTKAQEKIPEVVKVLMLSEQEAEQARIRGTITTLERQFNEYADMTRTFVMRLANERRNLERMNAAANNDSIVEKETAAILRIKKVKRVSTRMGKLVVYLNPTYITTSVGKYLIGDFEIEFGAGHHFKIRNPKSKIGDTEHPHILRGDPCLGNMKDLLLYAYRGELALCISATIVYLEDYNPQSAYRPIEQWPMVSRIDPKTREEIPLEQPVRSPATT